MISAWPRCTPSKLPIVTTAPRSSVGRGSPARQKPNFANTARRFGPYQGKVRQVQEGQEAVPGVRAVSSFAESSSVGGAVRQALPIAA